LTCGMGMRRIVIEGRYGQKQYQEEE
jgi:hypothetical protein